MSEKLVFKTKRGIYALPVDEIVFMEKDRRKIRVHTDRDTMSFTEASGNLQKAWTEGFFIATGAI